MIAMEGIFGARGGGFGTTAPVAYMYRLAPHDPAMGHMLGRWMMLQNDSRLSTGAGPLAPEHIRGAVKGGTLLPFADDWGADEHHVVQQFAVAVEKVDIDALMTQVPVITVAATVQHTLPDGPTYYTLDRGSLYPWNALRSPVQHSFRERTAALKKFGSIVSTWEDQPEYDVTRFVISPEASWHFNVDGTSTALDLVRSHYELAIERREQEIEEMMKQPLHVMNDDTFAQMFQKKMVEGS